MERASSLILVENDMRLRAAISHAVFRCGLHVEPFESVAELAAAWPRGGVILIHDTPGTIDDLIDRMALNGEWFPIVAYSEHPDASLIVQAVLDGAIDYVAWPAPPAELAAAIDRAVRRATTLGNVKLREVMARARVERLTRREREVLGGVASGLSNRLIGQKLSISPRTVEIHRANMLNKLGAHHTSDAIRIAVEAALVDACA